MSGSVGWRSGAIEARAENGTRIYLDVDWSDRLLQLLGRYPESFEDVERAWRVFPLFYDDAVERIAQSVRLVLPGTAERAIAERAFFGTNGLRNPETGEMRRTRFEAGPSPDDRLCVGDAVECRSSRRLGRVGRFAGETTDFWLDDGTGPHKRDDFVKLRPSSLNQVHDDRCDRLLAKLKRIADAAHSVRVVAKRNREQDATYAQLHERIDEMSAVLVKIGE